MATVRARARVNGATEYQVRWWDPFTGRQASAQYADRAEAQRFAAILTRCGHDLTKATEIVGLTKKAGSHTLDEVADLYVPTGGHAAPEGRARNRRIYDQHLRATFGHQPVESISGDQVAAWLLNERTIGGKVPADKSIANWHGLLSSILADAVKRGWAPGNVSAGMALPRRTGHLAEEMVFLTAAEFVSLLAEFTPRYRVLVQLLGTTGVRWGEATALQVRDVDLRATPPCIKVTKSMKRDEHNHLIVGPPKTVRSTREVSLTAEMAGVLTEYMEGRPRTERLFLPGPTGRPSVGRGGVRSSSAIAVDHASFWRNTWDPAVTRAMDASAHGAAALIERPRIHDLRHSFASWLIFQGVDIVTVSRMLGHESITTTVNRYGHLDRRAQQRAVDAMSRAMAGLAPAA